MNNITEINIASMPNSLQEYETIRALGKVIADYLNNISKEIDCTVIFPRIDELSEPLLDILAYDLHIDWYDYGYSLEQKRNIIKSSVNVHRRLGTRYGVETALKAVYPNSRVTPWFENGGEPYNFDVVLDISTAIKPVSYSRVSAIVNYYKSLRDNVSKTEFITRNDKSIYVGADVSTALCQVLNPLHDNIAAGLRVNTNIGVYISSVRAENVECEIITPMQTSSNTAGAIIGEVIVMYEGIVDEGAIGEASSIVYPE